MADVDLEPHYVPFHVFIVNRFVERFGDHVSNVRWIGESRGVNAEGFGREFISLRYDDVEDIGRGVDWADGLQRVRRPGYVCTVGGGGELAHVSYRPAIHILVESAEGMIGEGTGWSRNAMQKMMPVVLVATIGALEFADRRLVSKADAQDSGLIRLTQ